MTPSISPVRQSQWGDILLFYAASLHATARCIACFKQPMLHGATTYASYVSTETYGETSVVMLLALSLHLHFYTMVQCYAALWQ